MVSLILSTSLTNDWQAVNSETATPSTIYTLPNKTFSPAVVYLFFSHSHCQTALSASGRSYFYRSLGKEISQKVQVMHRILINSSFVTENPYLETSSSLDSFQPIPFLLPDGQTVFLNGLRDFIEQIQIGKEANSIPELLFYPTPLDDPSLTSLPLMIANQLNNCRKESSKDIASSVMLTGGVSTMKGLYTRLNRELSVMSKGVRI